MISLLYYNQLRFYCAKLLDTPKEDRPVLEFINLVVDSDEEDDNILEPESFFGVFNTFVNQWCVKKVKHVFKLGVRVHAFSRIPDVGNSHI